MSNQKSLGQVNYEERWNGTGLEQWEIEHPKTQSQYEAAAAAVVKEHEARKWRPITINEMYKRTRILGMDADGDVFITWHENSNGVWYWNSKYGVVQPVKWQPLPEAPNA